mgnify:CR=1 FL=1
MGILKRIEEELNSWNAPDYILNTIFLLFTFFLSTSVHELGHVLTSLLLGCKTGIVELTLFQGATGFECAIDSAISKILIAYGGGIFSFIVGALLWFSEGKRDMERGELSNIRLVAIIMFFLSSIFQLFPGYRGLDGYKAIEFGLNPLVAWTIWLFLLSLVANIVVSERKNALGVS